MGKLTICIGENKDADQLRSNCEADQRLCFRYADSRLQFLYFRPVYTFTIFGYDAATIRHDL